MNQILGKKKLNLQQLATFITYVKIKIEKKLCFTLIAKSCVPILQLVKGHPEGHLFHSTVIMFYLNQTNILAQTETEVLYSQLLKLSYSCGTYQ